MRKMFFAACLFLASIPQMVKADEVAYLAAHATVISADAVRQVYQGKVDLVIADRYYNFKVVDDSAYLWGPDWNYTKEVGWDYYGRTMALPYLSDAGSCSANAVSIAKTFIAPAIADAESKAAAAAISQDEDDWKLAMNALDDAYYFIAWATSNLDGASSDIDVYDFYISEFFKNY